MLEPRYLHIHTPPKTEHILLLCPLAIDFFHNDLIASYFYKDMICVGDKFHSTRSKEEIDI
jgi:hypothetical protein